MKHHQVAPVPLNSAALSDAEALRPWRRGSRLSEYAPSEWLGSGFERAHGRKLSPGEREALLVQIAAAPSELRMSMARRVGPRSPGAPRVDVRVIRGRAAGLISF